MRTRGLPRLRGDGAARRFDTARWQRHCFDAAVLHDDGAGVGITIPHVVVLLPNEPGFENYEFGGFGAQAIAGLSFSITKHVQLFTEYKFTYANLDKLDFNNGVTSGTVNFDSMANHLVFGVSYRL